MSNLTTTIFKEETFPIIYEKGKKKAVVMDIELFEKLEMILDNLLNRQPETEDEIISQSKFLKKIVAKYENIKSAGNIDWKTKLNEL